jgi:hypothetical protein
MLGKNAKAFLASPDSFDCIPKGKERADLSCGARRDAAIRPKRTLAFDRHFARLAILLSGQYF